MVDKAKVAKHIERALRVWPKVAQMLLGSDNMLLRRPSNRISMDPSQCYTDLLDVNLKAVSIYGWEM